MEGVASLAFVRSVIVSPDGKHVYAAGFGDNAVTVFSRNSTTGSLTFEEIHMDGLNGVDGIRGAISVTVSPDGKYVFAAGLDDNAVAVFSRNSTTGSLKFEEVHKDGVGGVNGLEDANSVTVSPDGNNLYVAGFADNAVVAFDVRR